MIFHRHRLRVSIRTQLIALVLFVAMFSLLILAIVTGVYFTSVLTDTRVSKLQVVAELKSSQLKQTMDGYYFQALQLSEKQSVQKALSMRKAGNTSASALQDVQQTMNQTVDASTSLAYASLYDLDYVLVASASNPDNSHNASMETLNELFILEQNISDLPDGLLANRGYLAGPVNDDFTYFISLTLPVYSNESILVPQQFLSGFLTVIVDLKAINASLSDPPKKSDYSLVNYIIPTHPYNNLTNYTGFFYAFDSPFIYENETIPSLIYNISSFPPATDVFEDGENLGSYVNIETPLNDKVSLGYSSIDLGIALWMVTVEQYQNEFKQPITKLIDIMIGLCIGLAFFMCLITFPLAHYGVRPILKLQKATEEITDRRGLKKKRRRKHVNPFSSLHTRMRNSGSTKEIIDEKNDNNNNNNSNNNNDNNNHENELSGHTPSCCSLSASIRHSWNGSFHSPSSIDSLSNSYTQDSFNNGGDNKAVTPLPSLVEIKGLFFDELTELTEAFNAMTLELDRQYSNLEDRVRARTKELEAAKVQADMARQQAEKANEAKTVFIANISHELRTPLNGILGMTSVAMSEKNIDKIQNSLELIFRSGELLLHILIQLLTFSKNQLDKSKLQNKNFLINEVASQIKSIFGKTAKDQDVNLVITLKPNLIRKLILYGDSNRIIQVVMNLVSNSLKFTPENGTVRVLIQLLGQYDEERSKNENYEKVYIKGLENDLNYYPVKPISKDNDNSSINDLKHSSTDDSSSIISTKTSSTLSTLRSSVYIKSLSSLYKSSDCEIEYFNDDEFSKDSESSESHHKSRKCYKFGDTDASWVLRFSVSDTGTGIEESLQDKIFEAFVQGDQTLSRSHGGTGLGLSICKQFAKMMHGTLTLDSAVNKGSTFTFTIPLPQVGEIILNDEELEEFSKDDFNEKYNNKRKKVKFDSDVQSADSSNNNDNNNNLDTGKMNLANSYKSTCSTEPGVDNIDVNTKTYDKPELITRASTGTAQSYKSRKSDTSLSENLIYENPDSNSQLKFLVAEDNSVNQEVVKRMLKLEGISNVFMARDGRDAVEFIRESINSNHKPFDLVLMDVQMPNLDGLSATKIIRKELGYKGPIVALTAFADVSNEKDCIEAGMSGFLSKPIRRNLLRNIIRQFCSKLNTPYEFDETEKSPSATKDS
jgi:osomolarity two-component system sensor histidine kinase SLN1